MRVGAAREPLYSSRLSLAGEERDRLERWAALFSKQVNIREVMAFPKTQSGGDLMLDAPSEPDPGQYVELGLRFVGLPEKTKTAAATSAEGSKPASA